MPDAGPSQISVRVLRFDPAEGGEPSWSEFETALVPGESVTGILWNINEREASGVAYRVSCHRGICASCIMKINGKQRLGCVTEVTGDLELAPAFGTVIKDLVVEQS
jgi:succinate dehydrogenase / fumarate reductase, iron-sulfur subunit